MGDGWEREDAWARQYNPELCAALARHLYKRAHPIADRQFGIDVILPEYGQSLRMRRHEFWLKYPDQITIRAAHPNGARTELQKIMAGDYAPHLCYGFANPGDDDGLLIAYRIVTTAPLRVMLGDVDRAIRGGLSYGYGWTLECNHRTDGVAFIALDLRHYAYMVVAAVPPLAPRAESPPPPPSRRVVEPEPSPQGSLF